MTHETKRSWNLWCPRIWHGTGTQTRLIAPHLPPWLLLSDVTFSSGNSWQKSLTSLQNLVDIRHTVEFQQQGRSATV